MHWVKYDRTRNQVLFTVRPLVRTPSQLVGNSGILSNISNFFRTKNTSQVSPEFSRDIFEWVEIAYSEYSYCCLHSHLTRSRILNEVAIQGPELDVGFRIIRARDITPQSLYEAIDGCRPWKEILTIMGDPMSARTPVWIEGDGFLIRRRSLVREREYARSGVRAILPADVRTVWPHVNRHGFAHVYTPSLSDRAPQAVGEVIGFLASLSDRAERRIAACLSEQAVQERLSRCSERPKIVDIGAISDDQKWIDCTNLLLEYITPALDLDLKLWWDNARNLVLTIEELPGN